MRRQGIPAVRVSLAGLVLLCGVCVPGTGAAHFDRLDTSSRALGFGEAYVALATDATASIYNPAGLGVLVQPEVQLTVAQPYFVPDLLSNTVAVAWPALGGGLGATWHRLGNEFASENLWSLAYGRWVYKGDRGSGYLGGALKLGHVGVESEPGADYASGATAVTADLGSLYAWNTGVSAAAVVHNLGEPNFEFVDGAGGTPWKTYADLGLAYRWRPESTVSLGWSSDVRQRDRWHVGGEIWFYDVFAVRAGIWATEFAGGVGLKTDHLEFDASFVTHTNLGLSGRFTVVVPVGGWRR